MTHTGRIHNSYTTNVLISITASAKGLSALAISHSQLMCLLKVCPYHTVNMMAANVADNFEYNGTIGHLNNCIILVVEKARVARHIRHLEGFRKH